MPPYRLVLGCALVTLWGYGAALAVLWLAS